MLRDERGRLPPRFGKIDVAFAPFDPAQLFDKLDDPRIVGPIATVSEIDRLQLIEDERKLGLLDDDLNKTARLETFCRFRSHRDAFRRVRRPAHQYRFGFVQVDFNHTPPLFSMFGVVVLAGPKGQTRTRAR